MILIADSGSTKCDWVLIDETRDTRVATEGINPFFCDAKRMGSIIGGKLLKKIDATDVNKVLFFGAGCRDDKKQLVHDSLSTYFPGSNIEVSTDLEAAAIALYGSRSGIAAILGTGSIACMYDGKSVVRSTRRWRRGPGCRARRRRACRYRGRGCTCPGSRGCWTSRRRTASCRRRPFHNPGRRIII